MQLQLFIQPQLFLQATLRNSLPRSPPRRRWGETLSFSNSYSDQEGGMRAMLRPSSKWGHLERLHPLTGHVRVINSTPVTKSKVEMEMCCCTSPAGWRHGKCQTTITWQEFCSVGAHVRYTETNRRSESEVCLKASGIFPDLVAKRLYPACLVVWFLGACLQLFYCHKCKQFRTNVHMRTRTNSGVSHLVCRSCSSILRGFPLLFNKDPFWVKRFPDPLPQTQPPQSRITFFSLISNFVLWSRWIYCCRVFMCALKGIQTTGVQF